VSAPDAAAVRRTLLRSCPLGRHDGARRGDDDLNPGLLSPVAEFVEAAVLIGLIARPDGLNVLLTRRTAHLSAHAGQCAFPGGRIEAWDASPESAALREAEEEVGLDPAGVEVLGRLDTYLVRTGFRVTPIVGLIDPPQTLQPDLFEVAAVFEAPLAFFLAPGTCRRASRSDGAGRRSFYVFDYAGAEIWGATAGMLVNLTDVLRGRAC
jgi:8-oxo-dGTP pyrophosphatase MutT (NUDIX family)